MRDTARRPTVRRIAGAAVVCLALPLAACTTGEAGGIGLVRDGCPTDIRIATDDLPRVEWGFLYGLLDPDDLTIGDDSVSSPLVIDGTDSGATLTILIGDPNDGVSGNVALHDDDSILLAAVDTDAALLDAARYPSVGVFAPTLRDSRIFFWDSTIYPGARTIRNIGDRLTPDGTELVPIVTVPGSPFSAYAIGDEILSADQFVTDQEPTVAGFVDSNRISAQFGDVLVDPYLLELPETGAPETVVWQLLDDAGYESDAGVLSVRPKALVRYTDCLGALVPVLQRALVDYLDRPEATTELLVELSAEFGDPTYDADLAAAAFQMLDDEDIAGNGRNRTIGDIDLGRVRDLVGEAVPAWREAGRDVRADIQAEDIVTNQFIVRGIGR